MPKPEQVTKASLKEIWWDNSGKPQYQNPQGGAGKSFEVQFNPETLKVTYANQKAGGDQPGNSPVQFVGRGTTKLSLQIWFDISLPKGGDAAPPSGDVRSLTQEVAYFMAPQKVTVQGKTSTAPPGVSFEWGSMIFQGVVDTMDETLDFFAADGRPLRASMNLGITQQEIKPQPPASAPGTGLGANGPGTQPLQLGKAGLSLQQMSANLGVGDWRAVADLNGIENPRQVTVGAQLDFSVGQ
jgi:Contractile injection system tube protein